MGRNSNTRIQKGLVALVITILYKYEAGAVSADLFGGQISEIGNNIISRIFLTE